MTLYVDPTAGLGKDRDAFRGCWEDRLRDRITRYLSGRDWDEIDWAKQDTAAAVRDFTNYLAVGLADDTCGSTSTGWRSAGPPRPRTGCPAVVLTP